MAESLGVYVPAMMFQKALGLARVFLLAYLMRRQGAQYGLWGAGVMLFTLAAPLLTLGSNHGLIRYVSFYEARGQFRRFYRRVRWCLVACVAAAGAIALAGSDLITTLVLVPATGTTEVLFAERLGVCMAALGNAVLMALYYNLLSFMIGLRMYRLVSAVEVFFGILFTALAAGLVMLQATAMTLLAAHLVALVATLLAGVVMLELAVRRMFAHEAPTEAVYEPQAEMVLAPTGEIEQVAQAGAVSPAPVVEAPDVKGAFGRLLRFGLIAVLGNFLFLGAQFVSFHLAYRAYGEATAGGFWYFLQLCQPVLFLGNAVWAVIFTHVARRWESGQRTPAMLTLETAYKGVAMTMMTLTVLIYVSSPLWIELLPREYHHARGAVGGLLMFFQVVTSLALTTMLAKLRERPIVIAVAAVAGIAVNAALAAWWMPLRGFHSPAWAQQGLAGAAWAAGLGMYVGAGGVSAVYFLLARVKMHRSTLLVFACPVLLVLPAWAAGCAWAGVLLAAVLTGWVFSNEQKTLLRSFARQVLGIFKIENTNVTKKSELHK